MKFFCITRCSRVRMSGMTDNELALLRQQAADLLAGLFDTGRVHFAADLGAEHVLLNIGSIEMALDEGDAPHRDQSIESIVLIDAPDLTSALRLARLHPAVKVLMGAQLHWSLELRPVTRLRGGVVDAAHGDGAFTM